MKKVIEDLNVFRKYYRVRQELNCEIQISISFIKCELQTPIENNISCKKKWKIFLIEWEWTKKLLTMNPMGKNHKNEHIIREYDISGW